MEIIKLINGLSLHVENSVVVINNEVFTSYDLYEDGNKLFSVENIEEFSEIKEIPEIIDRNIKVLENKIEVYIIARILLNRYPIGPSGLMLETIHKELDKLKIENQTIENQIISEEQIIRIPENLVDYWKKQLQSYF